MILRIVRLRLTATFGKITENIKGTRKKGVAVVNFSAFL